MNTTRKVFDKDLRVVKVSPQVNGYVCSLAHTLSFASIIDLSGQTDAEKQGQYQQLQRRFHVHERLASCTVWLWTLSDLEERQNTVSQTRLTLGKNWWITFPITGSSKFT